MSKKKRPRKKRAPSRSSSRSRGTLQGMRQGFKGLVGAGKKKKKKGIGFWDVLFWMLLAGLIGLLIYRFMHR